MIRVLIGGAGGFIGSHLARRLKKEGFWVRGVDLKRPEFSPTACDEFVVADLREAQVAAAAVDGIEDVYQLAGDMGGAGYLFTGDHDAQVMHNSALINLNMVEASRQAGVRRLFFTSSACIYPSRNQADKDHPVCSENSAYPAAPDSEYGWEKLFSERLYSAYARNYGMDVRIARLHNVFGPEGTWTGGKEKAPAAICRKVAEAANGGEIEIWGDGEQTRSFLHIDECLEGMRRIMESGVTAPVNLGSEEMVSINELVAMVVEIAKKELTVKHGPGPTGVRGRNSDNRLLREKLGWAPTQPLRTGLQGTYEWVAEQVCAQNRRGVGLAAAR